MLSRRTNSAASPVRAWRRSRAAIVFDAVDSVGPLVFITFGAIFRNVLVDVDLVMTVGVVTQQCNAMSRDEIRGSSHEEFLLNAILI